MQILQCSILFRRRAIKVFSCAAGFLNHIDDKNVNPSGCSHH